MHLLRSTDVVECDRSHRGRIEEIADWRIDERQVAVFADTEYGEARRFQPQERGVASALGVGLGREAVEPVERLDRHVRDQSIDQESAERRRMSLRDAEVLVEMECGDLLPSDSSGVTQDCEEFVL